MGSVVQRPPAAPSWVVAYSHPLCRCSSRNEGSASAAGWTSTPCEAASDGHWWQSSPNFLMHRSSVPSSASQGHPELLPVPSRQTRPQDPHQKT
eukprot:2428759-Amphidinium_carterae.2